MEADAADEAASARPEPWWVKDPEMVAIRQGMMAEFGPGSTRPAEPEPDEAPEPPELPDPVLVDVLSGVCWRGLASARDDLARAKHRYAEAIAAARGAGLSWGEIARVLGVSRQSLHRRFGGVGRVD